MRKLTISSIDNRTVLSNDLGQELEMPQLLDYATDIQTSVEEIGGMEYAVKATVTAHFGFDGGIKLTLPVSAMADAEGVTLA